MEDLLVITDGVRVKHPFFKITSLFKDLYFFDLVQIIGTWWNNAIYTTIRQKLKFSDNKILNNSIKYKIQIDRW